jgi:hypothetical protein
MSVCDALLNDLATFQSDGDVFFTGTDMHHACSKIVQEAVAFGSLPSEKSLLAKTSFSYLDLMFAVAHCSSGNSIVLSVMLCVEHYRETFGIPLRLKVVFVGGKTIVSSNRRRLDKSVNPAETLEELCKEPT